MTSPHSPSEFTKKNDTHYNGQFLKDLNREKRNGEKVFKDKVREVLNTFNPPISNLSDLLAHNFMSYSQEFRRLISTVLDTSLPLSFVDLDEYLEFLSQSPERPLRVKMIDHSKHLSYEDFKSLSEENRQLFAEQKGFLLEVYSRSQLQDLIDHYPQIKAVKLSKTLLEQSEEMVEIQDDESRGGVDQGEREKGLELIKQQLLQLDIAHLHIESSLEISCQFIVELLESLSYKHKIEILKLSSLSFVDNSLLQALAQHKHVKHLMLNSSGPTDPNGLSKEALKSILSLPHLKNFSSNRLVFDEQNEEALRVLKPNSSLHLSGLFTQENLNTIAGLPSLNRVSFVSGFQENLDLSPLKKSQIEHLTFLSRKEDSQECVNQLINNSFLRTLIMMSVEEMTKEFMESVSQLKQLEHLKLRWKAKGVSHLSHEEDMVEIFKYFKPSVLLQSLTLQQVELSKDCLHFLPTLENLQQLKLFKVISPENSIKKLLLPLKRLVHLDLASSNFPLDTFEALTEMKHLKYLHLKACINLSAEHLNPLIKCKNLRYIHLYSMRNFHQDIVDIIKKIESLYAVVISHPNLMAFGGTSKVFHKKDFSKLQEYCL